jgi:hypothetical protein
MAQLTTRPRISGYLSVCLTSRIGSPGRRHGLHLTPSSRRLGQGRPLPAQALTKFELVINQKNSEGAGHHGAATAVGPRAYAPRRHRSDPPHHGWEVQVLRTCGRQQWPSCSIPLTRVKLKSRNDCDAVCFEPHLDFATSLGRQHLRQELGAKTSRMASLIEATPVMVLDDVQKARRQHVGAVGEDARQCGPQPVQTLGYRDTRIERKSADLVDSRPPLAHQA